MSEATIEYKNSPNESTAYAVSEGQKTKVQLVATPAGDLELADNPNVDTGYLVINGEKHKCALVAEVAGELKLPTSATDDTGYVVTQDGRQHKVKLVANITGGGGGTTIRNQDKQITENGTYTADAGYTGLGTVTVNVPSGGGSASKYGVTIDNLLGNVDENGVYTSPSEPFTFDATDIQYVQVDKRGDAIGSYLFAGKKNLTGTVNLSNFKGVDYTSLAVKGYANFLQYAFAETGIETIILPGALDEKISGCADMKGLCSKCQNLHTIVFSPGFAGGFSSFTGCGLANAFEYCENIQTVAGIDGIVSLNTQSFFQIFYYAKNLPEEWRFDSLTTLKGQSLQLAFGYATGAKRFFFPSLINIDASAFGSMSSAQTFYQNTDVSEIHFRADMQATVEALTGYAKKLGATNATIFFDL